MKQSQLLRQSEAVSYLQEVEVDADNEVVVGKNVAFDLSGFDGTLADHAVLGGRCLAMQAVSGFASACYFCLCLGLYFHEP